MGRRPRVHFPGARYHLISRGNQRQRVYKDEQDHRRFETQLGEVAAISLTEAAKYLGRDLSTMSLAIKRLDEELQADIKRRKRLRVVCTPLRQGRKRQYQITNA